MNSSVSPSPSPAPLDPDLGRILLTLQDHLGTTGTAPTLKVLAAEVGISMESLRSRLRKLVQSRHLIYPRGRFSAVTVLRPVPTGDGRRFSLYLPSGFDYASLPAGTALAEQERSVIEAGMSTARGRQGVLHDHEIAEELDLPAEAVRKCFDRLVRKGYLQRITRSVSPVELLRRLPTEEEVQQEARDRRRARIDARGLTAEELQVLTLIHDGIATTGTAPSYEDLVALTGFSVGSLQRRIAALDAAGYLERGAVGSARTRWENVRIGRSFTASDGRALGSGM